MRYCSFHALCLAVATLGCGQSAAPPSVLTDGDIVALQHRRAELSTVRGIEGAPHGALVMWNSSDNKQAEYELAHATELSSEQLHRLATDSVVDLRKFRLSDSVRSELRENQSIRWLRLPPGLGVEELDCISDMRKLQGLCITNGDLRGADLGKLASMTELAFLELSRTQLTARELQSLPPLPTLQYLGIRERETDDATVAQLTRSKLPKLRVLGLGETAITDVAIRHLADEFELEVLGLFGVPGITSQSIRYLGSMKSLRYLELSASGISPDDTGPYPNKNVAELIRLLPGCQIEYQD